MNKIFLSILVLFGVGFAVDAKLEIIKARQKLPSIMVNVYGTGLPYKVSNLVAKDLEVSGNFRVSTQNKNDNDPNYTFYQTQKIDLLVEIVQEKNRFNLFLYDINAKERVLQKSYVLQDSALYPFVSHTIANDVNNYLKAPSIAWMNRKVIFSKLLGPSKSEIVVADYTLSYQKSIIDDGLNVFPK